MIKPLILFKPDLPKLSKNEKVVLGLLTEAGKLIAPLYQAQENHKFPGANFYPHDVSKKEIENAAKKDPEILSPYSVVEKKDGQLITIPYHQKYLKWLKPISEKLIQAAEITENKEFGQRLRIQAKALLTGCYEESIITWLTMKPYILDIVIGPIERYDDKLFFVKTAYQAWVGVIDRKESIKATEFKKIILSSQREILMPSEHVDFFNKVQVRVDNTVLFAGLISRFKFIGTNLPNEIHLMEMYGSEITIFKPSLDYWFKKQHYITFKTVFEKTFQQSYDENGLRKGSMYRILLHELAHSFMRYRDAEKRLGNLFPVIDEIAASVVGVKACGALLIKDAISQKDLEYILVMFMARLFDWVNEIKADPSVMSYVRGNAIALSFLLSSGALKQAGGISWPNFTKMFMAIDDLAAALNRILSQGSYRDAEHFIDKYGSLNIFNNFKTLLKKIK